MLCLHLDEEYILWLAPQNKLHERRDVGEGPQSSQCLFKVILNEISACEASSILQQFLLYCTSSTVGYRYSALQLQRLKFIKYLYL